MSEEVDSDSGDVSQFPPGTKVTAADLLGSATIGDGHMVNSVIMVVEAIDIETGEAFIFVVEDDDTPPHRLYGLLCYAKDTFFDGISVDDEDD